MMIRVFSAIRQKQLLSLTNRAKSRINEMLLDQPSDIIGIKLSLKKRGCSGLSYSMDYASEVNKLDEVIPLDQRCLIIDAKAVMFVIGTTIDYSYSEIAEEFTFSNPNAKGSCGCGESFTV